MQQSNGFTLMTAPGRPTAFMEAQINGTLTITDSGCFAVASGEVVYPLQFPFGTVLGDDGQTIQVPGLDPLKLGDPIHGEGGYVALDTVPPDYEAENEHAESVVWQTVAN